MTEGRGQGSVRVERIGDATLYLADCLDVMVELDSADAVIMDPPYSSGARTSAEITGRSGMSRGQKWKAKPLPNDRMTVTGFSWLMRHVAGLSYDILPEGGSLLSFIDWRQYPTLYGIVESVNFRVQNVVVWDKKDMTMGNGFRNQHEFIIHASKGVPTIHERSTANVICHKRVASSEDHPTQKPIDLMKRLLPVVTAKGERVVDPFMGSGTTGIACAALGRSFIGIESDPDYFDVACKRIKEAFCQADMLREWRQSGGASAARPHADAVAMPTNQKALI